MDIEQITKTYKYENGEIQRVQMVKAPSWESLDFFTTSFSKEAFDGVIDVIDTYQVQRYPMLFGTMVFFHIPEGVEVPFSNVTSRYGKIADKNIKASILFKERFKGGCFVPKNAKEQEFVDKLMEAGTFRVLKGKLSKVSPMPFSEHFGRMSETQKDATVKVNSSFFVMDSFDCATVYDTVGTPIGLCVKNGEVKNPPLYEREAIIVREGKISVELPRLSDCSFSINNKEYIPGRNCRIYERPIRRTTRRTKGTDLVIVGCEVKAVKDGGKTIIPGGGFVLQTDERVNIEPGTKVTVNGYSDVSFAIQVGNSIVKNGVPYGHFISEFYNIRKLFDIPYPPCFYPLDYLNSKAARIAIGSDSDGKPCLIWAEGAAKIGHEKGKDSCGASLSDMELFCKNLDVTNAINLDGGGSAEMLINNNRSLQISDRREDGTEKERGVPIGLIIR